MVRAFTEEDFKEFSVPARLRNRYAVSNFGRLVSFTDTILEGNLLQGGQIAGYKVFRYKVKENDKLVNKNIFVHRLVAELFLERPDEEYTQVIHIDFNHGNNHIHNLRWATRAQSVAHQKNSPLVQEARLKLIEFNKQRDGQKLTSTQVIYIKKRLADPTCKTRMKMLAKQFGISEMQLYRIKRGENWGHLHV
jgi:hypothetical protein